MIKQKKIYILLSMILSVCNLTAIDGTMDRYFAMGQAYEDLPICKAVASQIDGKMLVGGYVETNGKKTFAVARVLQNGMIDHTFGKNGVVITPFTNGETASSAQAIMIDTAGKIVAAGFTNGINNVCHACLARYNADGSLDKSFFGGRAVFKGTVITTFGSIEEISHINGLVETVDQKIVAVGGSYSNNAACFALARYNNDGSLDVSFNPKGNGSACGTVRTQFESSTNDEAFAAALDCHAKLVVAGSSYASGIKTFALARYQKDGSLDQSFYNGNGVMHGTVVTNFMCGETEGAARAVRVQADGKILVGGYTNAFSGAQNITHFALARYTAQGMLDVGFGSDSALPGTIVTNFGNENVRSCINALIIQTDNKIVAGGFAEFNKTKYFALARYECDGSCDYTFNGGGAPSGKVLSRCSSNNSDEVFGLALVSPGDIVAVGRSNNHAISYGAIARYICDQDMNCPEILSPCHDQVVVNGACVKAKGHAQNSSRVQIYLDDRLVDTVYAKANKCWECKLPALIDGEHSLQVCEHYDAGNVCLKSKKIKMYVDQHPVAVNQSVECQGMRQMQGSLAARGASGDYSYRVTKENNCKVTLNNQGAYTLKATIPSGHASFDFEVQDKVTQYVANGTVSIIVREIPTAGSIILDAAQDKPLHGSLEAFIVGGQKPYAFEVMNEANSGQCVVNPDGSFVFTPRPEFVGLSGFKFAATDAYKVTSDPGRVSVQVHSIPRATEYVINELCNTQIKGQVSSYAFDGRKPYKYSISPVQHHCSVTMDENGAFTCMPEADYCGVASFEYTVTDMRGFESKPCLVTINLYERIENNSEAILGIKNKSIKKQLTDLIGKKNKRYTFSLAKQPENGTAHLNESGMFEFIPHEGFVGIAHCSVKVHEQNTPEQTAQIVPITMTIKDMQDFETVVIDLYENEIHGDLCKNEKSANCMLYHVPNSLHVALSKQGKFSFQIVEESSASKEFLYTITDKSGTSKIKRAQIVLHKYPIAQSLIHELSDEQAIQGNLHELVSEGIAPYTYKIVSAKNGKVECRADGSYSFKPRYGAIERAEFTFVAIDSRNNSSNVAKVEFPLVPKPVAIEAETPSHGEENILVDLQYQSILEPVAQVLANVDSHPAEQMEVSVEEVIESESVQVPNRSSKLHRFIRSINK